LSLSLTLSFSPELISALLHDLKRKENTRKEEENPTLHYEEETLAFGLLSP